jgi:hypothetical protein
MFGSVNDSVLELTMEDEEPTARVLWLAVERLFRSNKQSQAILLSQKFHSMTQGDLSITEYSQKMKSLTDALRDVGHPVQDSQLVLNLLRGLNPRYSNTADGITNNKGGFPSFADARDLLTMKELRLANETKVANFTALLVGTGSSCTSPGGCRSTSSSVQSSSGGGQQKKPAANNGSGGRYGNNSGNSGGYGNNGKRRW